MRRLLLLLLPLAGLSFGQNAALPPPMHMQFFDANGKPLSGGRIYTCTAGSTCPGNPLATYTDSTATTQNANPVVLDSSGFGNIWIGNGTYKFVAQNSAGVQQWTQDNISSTSLKSINTSGGALNN